jgi:hypothetical protein
MSATSTTGVGSKRAGDGRRCPATRLADLRRAGAHFDLGWCGSIAETLAYGTDLIRRVLDELTGTTPTIASPSVCAASQGVPGPLPRLPGDGAAPAGRRKLEVCCTMTGATSRSSTAKPRCGWWPTRRGGPGARGPYAAYGPALGPPGHHPDPVLACPACATSPTPASARPGLHSVEAPDGSRVRAHHRQLRLGVHRAPPRRRRAALSSCALERAGTGRNADRLLMTGQSDLLPGAGCRRRAPPRRPAWLPSVTTLSEFFASVSQMLRRCPSTGARRPTLIRCRPGSPTRIASAGGGAPAGAGEVLSSLRDAGSGRHRTRPGGRGKLFYPQDHNVGGRTAS